MTAAREDDTAALEAGMDAIDAAALAADAGDARRSHRLRFGEAIGGGWFVFRRTRRTGRVKPGPLPFEHPSRDAAETEARRLAALCPGVRFEVYTSCFTARVEPPRPEPAAPEPASPDRICLGACQRCQAQIWEDGAWQFAGEGLLCPACARPLSAIVAAWEAMIARDPDHAWVDAGFDCGADFDAALAELRAALARGDRILLTSAPKET